MKTLKLITHSMLYNLLIGSLLIIGGCKKEKNQPQVIDSILGGWRETATPASTFHMMYFSNDGTFISTLTYNDDKPVSVLKSSGTFKIKGDSLFITIKEQSTQRGAEPAIKTPLDLKLYDDATFEVTNTILTLKYTTYPADAPVSTQVKFQKQLPD